MNDKPDSIPSKKPGRPKSVRVIAAKLIGSVNIKALEDADLHIVTGAYLRQGNLFLPQQEKAE